MLRVGFLGGGFIATFHSKLLRWAATRLSTDPGAGRVLSVVFRDDQFISVQGRFEFLLSATTGTPAWLDVRTALDAHRLADACYRSADVDGAPVAIR